jgi:cell division protein FtsL
VASWSPTAAAPAATRPRTRARVLAKPRKRVAGGALTIAISAILLAGVVALNVAVLRLNLRLDDLGRTRATLRAENAALSSQISSAAASAAIQAQAGKQLGLVPASPDQTTYIHLDR